MLNCDDTTVTGAVSLSWPLAEAYLTLITLQEPPGEHFQDTYEAEQDNLNNFSKLLHTLFSLTLYAPCIILLYVCTVHHPTVCMHRTSFYSM